MAIAYGKHIPKNLNVKQKMAAQFACTTIIVNIN